MCPLSGRAKAKRRSPSTRTGRKRYLPPVGKRERLTPFVLAGLLLRFAAGVAARTGILAVGAGSRTILLPLHVNGRLLTGTGATTTSSLRIFFHSCHVNLHETFGLKVFLARSVPRWRIRYRQGTMKCLSRHPERHNTHRIGWLRAAVLGANDGVLSTSSLVIGIAASNVTHGAILISG